MEEYGDNKTYQIQNIYNRTHMVYAMIPFV